MLIGELVETAEHYPTEQSLPYFAGIFASRSCVVLAHPLHTMYTKINKFLHKGPAWNLDKLPSYWVDRILLHPPTEDDGYHTEVEWLLDFLVDGLRTAKVCLRLLYNLCYRYSPVRRTWKFTDEAISSNVCSPSAHPRRCLAPAVRNFCICCTVAHTSMVAQR